MEHIIVVGAGILGASVGYHLAKMDCRVTLVDGQDQGQSTYAAAGILCPWLALRRKPAWHRLTWAGVRYYATLIRELGVDGEQDTGYAPVGTLFLNEDVGALRWMERLARERRREAPEMGDIVLLSPRETRELFPLLDDRYSSLFVSGGARVDGWALRNALLRAARRSGAMVLRGRASLAHENRRVYGVAIEGEVFRADTVVVTAGVWANLLLYPLGVTMRVRPKKGQILHFECRQLEAAGWPVVRAPGGFYIAPFAGGRIVTGSTHEDVPNLDLAPTAGGMLELLRTALSLAAGLKGCVWTETRTGLRPYTTGGMPAMGRVPGIDGLVVANGLGALGLSVGPYFGAQIARWLLGEPTELDLADYGAGKLFRSISGGPWAK